MRSVWDWLLSKNEFNIAVQARYAIPTEDTALINHRHGRIIYNKKRFEDPSSNIGPQYKKYLVMKTYLDMMFQYPYKENKLEKVGREIFVNHALSNMEYENEFRDAGVNRETRSYNYFGIDVPLEVCEEGSIAVIKYLKAGKVEEMYSELNELMKNFNQNQSESLKEKIKKLEEEIKKLEARIEKAMNADAGEEPDNTGNPSNGNQQQQAGENNNQTGETDAAGNAKKQQNGESQNQGDKSGTDGKEGKDNKESDKKEDIDKEREIKDLEAEKVQRLCGEHGPNDEVRRYQKVEIARISKGIWIHFIHSILYAIGQAKYGKSYARPCRWLPKDSKMKLPGRSRSRKAADMRLYTDVSGSMSGVIDQILGMVEQLKKELRKSANIICKYFDDYLYDDADKAHGGGTDFDIIFEDARNYFIDGALVVITDGEASMSQWDKYNDEGFKTYVIGINATIPHRNNRVCFRIEVEEDRNSNRSMKRSMNNFMNMLSNYL